MKPPKIRTNIAVENILRTDALYKAVGIQPNHDSQKEDLTSFVFDGDDYVIHIFLREKIALAIGGPVADLSNGAEVMFTLAAITKDEVAE